MLFRAVSSRCFSDSSRCCASRFCRVICRTIRNRMKAITSADRIATDNQESGLRAPVGKRGRDRRGRDDHDRELAQLGRRPSRSCMIDGTFHPQGLKAALGQNLVQQRRRLEFLPDQRIDVRMPRQHRSIAMEQGNRGVLAKHDGREEFFEIDGVDALRHHAQRNPRPARSGDGRSPWSSRRYKYCEPVRPAPASIAGSI